MRRIALVALLANALISEGSLAQSLPNKGQPSESTTALVVDSTRPIIYECQRWGSAMCFRVFFDIKPVADAEIRVAAVGSGGSVLSGTNAFAATGTSCLAEAISGLPQTTRYTNGGVGWGDRKTPYYASQQKPGNLMVEFQCDGTLVAGDELRIQLTLAVDPDGRGMQFARFVFSDKLQARR